MSDDEQRRKQKTREKQSEAGADLHSLKHESKKWKYLSSYNVSQKLYVSHKDGGIRDDEKYRQQKTREQRGADADLHSLNTSRRNEYTDKATI